jgi:hypothetical protein
MRGVGIGLDGSTILSETPEPGGGRRPDRGGIRDLRRFPEPAGRMSSVWRWSGTT